MKQIQVNPDNLPLKLGTEDFPDGWLGGAISPEAEWGYLDMAYAVSYGATIGEQDLVARFVYRQYKDSELATDYYEQYIGAVFFEASGSPWIRREASHSLYSPDFEIKCTVLLGWTKDTPHCTYWGRYNNCIIQFSTNINNNLMTVDEFLSIVALIDERMRVVNACKQ